MHWLERSLRKLDQLGVESALLRERWWEEYGERREEVFGEAFGRLESRRDVHLSFLAVDSAFARLIYLHADLFLVAAAAMGLDGQEDEPFWDSAGAVEQDGLRRARLLEGLAFAHEVLLAARHASRYVCVLLDGALLTFLIKLNSAFAEAFRGGLDPLSRKMRKLYGPVSEAFATLLQHEGLVAVPKAFPGAGDELEGFLSQRLGGELVNGYAFLEAVLEEGEYVVVEGAPKAVSWSGGRRRGDILSAINRRKLVFLKGASGRVFKFEFPNVEDRGLLNVFLEFLYAYTVEKEVLPLKLVDERAKALLAPLAEGLAFAEPYRD